MTAAIKICGLRTPEAVSAATEAGASHLGFVFFKKSPRNISAVQAATLASAIPPSVIKTGVFVNPDETQLDTVLGRMPLDLIQLHGAESPDRVREIKAHYKIPVMKAIAISGPDDIALARTYERVADMLLFDAKPPPALKDALPGGNGLYFDWQLLSGTDWQIPWMLSGGLKEDNIQQAIAMSGAKMVDVSSGVENRPGEKNIAKIKDFIRKVTEL